MTELRVKQFASRSFIPVVKGLERELLDSSSDVRHNVTRANHTFTWLASLVELRLRVNISSRGEGSAKESIARGR